MAKKAPAGKKAAPKKSAAGKSKSNGPVSKEELEKIADMVSIFTMLEGFKARYHGFLELVKDDDGEVASPPAVKSPHSHIMKDIREEHEDACELARVHNDSDPDDGIGAGVMIEVLDNMPFGKATKGADPDFPDGIADPTLFRLEFQGKTSTISVGSGRSAGASIAGIRLATSLMTKGKRIREGDLDRKLSGTLLPDDRILAWDMESLGSENQLMIAFERNEDHRYFIEGYEAATALFAEVAAVKKAA